MRASPRKLKIPLLSLCFHSVFMFLFVFQLKELQRVGLTRDGKRWSVQCQSKCEWKWDGTLATAAAECYGEIQSQAHSNFGKLWSQVSKAFLWKQKTIADRNQLFKLSEGLLPTKRCSHLKKNRKSSGYRYTRCAISWIRFVLKAAFRTGNLSTVSKLMNESTVLFFTENSGLNYCSQFWAQAFRPLRLNWINLICCGELVTPRSKLTCVVRFISGLLKSNTNIHELAEFRYIIFLI